MRKFPVILQFLWSFFLLVEGSLYDWDGLNMRDVAILQKRSEDVLNNSDERSDRLRRSAGSAGGWDDAVFDLSILTTVSSTGMPLGDSLSLTLRLEFPSAISSASPLSVILSGTNPENKTSSVHLCNPAIDTIVGFPYHTQ